jgi:hypothetical protein
VATRFASLFKRTGASHLIRQFGEPVIYYPGGPNHQAREIQAIVERNDPAVIAALGDSVGQSLILRVLNDVSLGILSTEIDSGIDRISVPLTEGDAPALRSIVQILGDSGGFVRFLVQ